MIVDASAILPIVLLEDDRFAFQDAPTQAKTPPGMSCVNFFEAAIRCDRLDAPFSDALSQIIRTSGIGIVDASAQDAAQARTAYRRFGKGNHPAKLNLGDCFACALAKARGELLLFKGDFFRQTAVEAVL